MAVIVGGFAQFGAHGFLVAIATRANSDLKIDAPLAMTATPGAKATPAPPSEFAAGANDAPTSPAAPASPTPAPTPTTIKVFVTGRVRNPGVYEMNPGDRAQQAIQKAGGFLPDADTETLNLADYVRDADKYDIGKKPAPAVAAVAPPPTTVIHSDRAPVNAAAKAPAPGRVLGSRVSPSRRLRRKGRAALPPRPLPPSSRIPAMASSISTRRT